jgi:hypothetical protein
MTYVDSALVDAFEWLCRRFQRLTGRTNVWVAFQLTNLSIVVFFVWAGMHFRIADRPLRIALVVFCAALLYLLTQTVFKMPVEAYEKSAYHRVARGLRNPRRLRDAPLRISFLALSALTFFPILFVSRMLHLAVFAVGYWLTVLTTLVLYVLACDPLPPCAGRVREWLRGLATAARTAADPVRGE